MSDKPNPLFIHGIIVIVVGAVLLGIGAWGTIQSAMSKKPRIGGASQSLSKARMARSRAGSVVRSPSALARKPTSISGGISQARNLAYTGKMIKGYLRMGWQILLGAGMIAAGIFVMKRKNWARLVGFGGIAFAVLLFSSYEGALVAHPSASVALPLILVVVVAGLSGKPLFDLMIEKFD